MNWSERKTQFERFAAWESQYLRARPTDFASQLAWMAAAWEVARRFDPEWGGPTSALEHWDQLQRLRSALTRARLAA